MSVHSKMTAIADKIRALRGTSGTMGLDAMATNLTTVQTNVSSAFTAIGNKGGTVPSSKVSGNLASAINSIPAGVTVQRKSGTFTTDSAGNATVNCGFQPDVIVIPGFSSSIMGADCEGHLAVVFSEKTTSKSKLWSTSSSEDYMMVNVFFTRTSSGFTAYATCVDQNLNPSIYTYKQFSYIAIKYTA